jgi:hypothetical protein
VAIFVTGSKGNFQSSLNFHERQWIFTASTAQPALDMAAEEHVLVQQDECRSAIDPAILRVIPRGALANTVSGTHLLQTQSARCWRILPRLCAACILTQECLNAHCPAGVTTRFGPSARCHAAPSTLKVHWHSGSESDGHRASVTVPWP